MEAPARTPFRALANSGDIRVLHLTAGERDTPLDGWLEHTRLDDDPDYEAISYEWGNPEKTRAITLRNDVVLPITEALYDALRDLRQDAAPEPRVIWVDAICINQQDIEELQNQVSIMATIYRRAEQAVTYIGPERDNSTLAIACARDIYRYLEALKDSRLAIPALPPLSDRHWKAVKALTLRTWVSSPIMLPSEAPTNGSPG